MPPLCCMRARARALAQPHLRLPAQPRLWLPACTSGPTQSYVRAHARALAHPLLWVSWCPARTTTFTLCCIRARARALAPPHLRLAAQPHLWLPALTATVSQSNNHAHAQALAHPFLWFTATFTQLHWRSLLRWLPETSSAFLTGTLSYMRTRARAHARRTYGYGLSHAYGCPQAFTTFLRAPRHRSQRARVLQLRARALEPGSFT